MASRFHDLNPNDRYLAGLCESSLCFDLMWYTLCGPPDRTHAEVLDKRNALGANPSNRMPAWSWASTREQALWLRGDKVLDCVKIMDITYLTKGPETVGGVLEATITLQAPLFSLNRINEDNSTGFQNPWITIETVAQSTISTATVKLLSENISIYWDDYGSHGNPNFWDTQLFALFVTVKSDLSGPHSQSALLVKESQRPGTWVRLGTIPFRTAEMHMFKEAAHWDQFSSSRGEQEEGTKQEKFLTHNEYNARFIATLEASETRVLTLV